jgi:NTP pyrophosphatase (non-canonical NTP hydrolase)
MSNFTKVAELNKAFGRATTSKANTDWKEIERQLDLIESEFHELRDAIRIDRDWEEMKDGIGDVLVTAYGLAYVTDIDGDKLMENISKSNFSKFCTEQEAIDTQAFYNSKNVQVEFVSTIIDSKPLIAVKSAKEQEYTSANGRTEIIPKGKLLKNINWHEPDLNVEN